MQLSAHFSLEEMTRSETAVRKGLNNSCPAALVSTLKRTAERMEAVRNVLGDVPLRVFSGYRSPEVNRAVGGAKVSAHTLAFAVDFIKPGQSIAETIDRLRNSPLIFDQLIDEFGAWVHISFDPRSRRQVMTARKVDKKTVYSLI
jgi:hypothetical protein